ncbi:hypothetical protein KCU73_g18134, partial [Aureobasidium melanogenum]
MSRARATSAAPGFWDTITLLGSAYQDGGLSHNNPSAIAIGEANVLASSRNADSSLIVSVWKPGATKSKIRHGGGVVRRTVVNIFTRRRCPVDADLRF